MSVLVHMGFREGNCPSLWLEDSVPRAHFFTLPVLEVSWPPGRFVLRWPVGGAHTGMFSFSVGVVCSRCVGARARALLGVVFFSPRLTQPVTRGLSCISLWAPTDMFSLFFLQRWSVVFTQGSTHFLLHKVHVSNLTFQPFKATFKLHQMWAELWPANPVWQP